MFISKVNKLTVKKCGFILFFDISSKEAKMDRKEKP